MPASSTDRPRRAEDSASDGWIESSEIEAFGVHATVVDPGFFRTEPLTEESRNYAPASIEDYVERNEPGASSETIVFEFNANSLVDAGHKVNDAVKHAAEADDMEAKSTVVVTPPASPAVALPGV